jgi:hypothetical protein
MVAVPAVLGRNMTEFGMGRGLVWVTDYLTIEVR